MTAYTSAASGDCNVGATWSPSGVPTNADTVSIGAHTITVPNGVTFNPGAMSLTGTGTSTRAQITVAAGGILQLGGAVTINAWNKITLNGNAQWDLNGYTVSYTVGGTSANNKIIVAGSSTDYAVIKGVGGVVQFSDTTPAPGELDMQYCLLRDIAFAYGGSYYAGSPFNVRDVVMYAAGYFRTYAYTHNNSDWIFERVDIRDSISTNGADEICRILLERSAAGGTGLRRLRDVTVDCLGGTAQRFRVQRLDFEAVNLISKGANFEFVSALAGNQLTNCFFNLSTTSGSSLGSGAVVIDACYMYSAGVNPHTCENLGTTIKNGVIEATYPPGTLDAGDHFPVKAGTNLTVDKMLIIDGWGGVMFNALGGVVVTSPTGTHNTIIADSHIAIYGVLARNETGGTYSGTTTLQSNLCYVRNNETGSSDLRAINIETSGNDQIDVMDYNAYYGFGSNEAVIYYQVTSATKSIGDSGYGLNDMLNVNPNFVDDTRGLASWQSTQNGGGDADDAITALLLNNGYNGTTHMQDASAATNIDIGAMVTWVRDGFAPTNIIYQNAGHDGVTIGAIEYVSAAGIAGITSSRITSGITRQGITSRI